MRREKIILLVCAWLITLTTAMAQQKKSLVTLVCNNTPLPTALAKVEQQSGYYKINYDYAQVAKYKVTASIKRQDAVKAVNTLLDGLPLKAEADGRFIHIQPASKAQPKKAKPARMRTVPKGSAMGRIVDSHGEPLVGVNVIKIGGSVGTITDMEGNFVLSNVKENDVLVCTYIGMDGVKVKATGRPMEIIMHASNHTLDDVVVTGYQTLSKERSAGSFGTVKGEDVSAKMLTTNSILDGLEGLTTGLSVNHGYGADRYIIRGITSINSTRSPLYVVDGVPLDESLVEEMVSSNDIQNVTVLKDATAASIWGSQAANGVIVITTKHGQRESKMRISYNGSITSYGKPDYSYYKLMDGKTFMKNAQEMFDEYSDTYSYDAVQGSTYGASHDLCYRGELPVVWPHEQAMYDYKNGNITLEERDARLNYLAGLDGRGQYEKYFMSNKFYTQHNLSLSGGSDRHTYFLSINYKGDKGNNKDWTDKVNVNAYQDFRLTKWLKWDITVNASFGNRSAKVNPFVEDNVMRNSVLKMDTYSGDVYYNLPYNIFKDANGWVDQSPMVLASSARQTAEQITGVDLTFHPVDDFNSSSDKTINTDIRLNTGLTVNLLKGLKYEGRFQYSRIHSKREIFRPSNSYAVREERAQTYSTIDGAFRVPEAGGHFQLSNNVTSDWTLRNQLNYDGEFNDGKHQITAIAGTEVRSYCNTGYTNYLRGYDMQTMIAQPYDVYALRDWMYDIPMGSAAAARSTTYAQTESAKKYFSLYANAAYTYDYKYTVNASMRIDQSNLFGSEPSNQYKPIWAVGAAWKISDEKFMKSFTWMDELKLRASFGFAGNSPQPGTGGRYDILGATSSRFFTTTGYNIITPANDKLTWEKTRTINLGFDVRLLRNRISLSFDYYDKYTKDLIGDMNLNPTTGWLTTTGNLGEMSNRGLEISLNTTNIQTKDFQWRSMLTFSTNKNKIEKLDVVEPLTLASDVLYQNYVEGYPVGALFSYRYAGLNSEGRPQAYDENGNIVEGYDVQDLKKEALVYSGTTVPKFYGALTNTLSYKNFELSFMLAYNFGAKMRKDSPKFYGRVGSNLLASYDKRWRKPGDEAFTDIPRYNARYDYSMATYVYTLADTHILDASYIRLRNLSISYQLPYNLCHKLGIESVKLTGQIGNLFLIAFNHEGIDPEAFYYSSGSYDSRTEKFGPSYSFGINVNF